MIKRTAKKILDILLNLQQHSLFHGNLKPENIMIDDNNEIELSDSKTTAEMRTKSLNEIRYLSPEVINQDVLTIFSDVWSFGIVMLELALGRDNFLNTNLLSLETNKIKNLFRETEKYTETMIDFISLCFKRNRVLRSTIQNLLNHDWLKSIREETIQRGLFKTSEFHTNVINRSPQIGKF